jgi:hypothetical protein
LKCFTATTNTVGEIVNISNYDIFIRKIMFNRKIIGLMLFEISKRIDRYLLPITISVWLAIPFILIFYINDWYTIGLRREYGC